MSELVAVERAAEDARIVIITLKGAALNALGEPMLRALGAAIERARGMGPRCAIVRSADERAFSAGADIAAMKAMSKAQALEYAQLGHATFVALERFPCPVIAEVNGFALGGGCELVLACDFIYASDKIKIGQPEVKLGVMPGFGGTQRLPRRIGLARARELMYTGRQLNSEEALRIGLVNAVFPRAELHAAVIACAQEIVRNGPLAVRRAKRLIDTGFDGELAAGLEREARVFANSFAEPEQQAGMNAFLAKQAPDFSDPTDDDDADGER
jgi:enoyl-CoA hydratase